MTSSLEHDSKQTHEPRIGRTGGEQTCLGCRRFTYGYAWRCLAVLEGDLWLIPACAKMPWEEIEREDERLDNGINGSPRHFLLPAFAILLS